MTPRKERAVASNYAPKQFFRQVRIELLREYFTRRHALGGVEWDDLRESEVEGINEGWLELPDRIRDEIESEFRQVHAMATANGIRAIIEEGRYHGLDLRTDLDVLDGYLNKVFWTLLKHRQVFNIAQLMDRADHLNRKCWRKRKDVPKKNPDV